MQYRPCGALVERSICYPSRAVGLILDLAVAALALIVIGSLTMLTWTLAVGAVRATRERREQVAGLRQRVIESEARLRSSASHSTSVLAALTQRRRRWERETVATNDDEPRPAAERPA